MRRFVRRLTSHAREDVLFEPPSICMRIQRFLCILDGYLILFVGAVLLCVVGIAAALMGTIFLIIYSMLALLNCDFEAIPDALRSLRHWVDWISRVIRRRNDRLNPSFRRLITQEIRLDGTQPLAPDRNTIEEVDHGRAMTFSDVVDNIQSMSRTPTVGESGRPLEMLRHQLQELRRESFQGTHQSLPDTLPIKVCRNDIIQQTLRCLASVPSTTLLARRLRITFEGEMGVDEGGLSRDWFESLGCALFSASESENGHLTLLPDNTVGPRPHDTRLTDLLAIGRLAGLAVWFGIPCPLPLSRVACKFLLGKPVNAIDVQCLDPEFYNHRIKPVLKDGGVDDLEAALGEPLMFVPADAGTRCSKELCPCGANRKVTEESKQEYLKLLCKHHLCGGMEEQIGVLLQGFWDICPKDVLVGTGMSHRDLAILISGYSEVDAADWRNHASVHPPMGSDVIDWFREIVSDMPSECRARLLHFATGSSRLKPSGFEGMNPRFKISVQDHHLEQLPHAHTCVNQLVLPHYASKEVLAEKLRLALASDPAFGVA